MFFHHKTRKRKIGVGIAAIVVAIVLIFVWLRMQKKNSESQVEYQKAFENVLLNPIPSGVKNIQGVSIKQGGTDTYLKFETPSEVVNQIMALHPYKKIECSDRSVLQPLFAPAEAPKNYSGSKNWDILDLKTPECFATLIFNETGIDGKLYSNKLRQNAQSEIIFDSERNIIYFHESGI